MVVGHGWWHQNQTRTGKVLAVPVLALLPEEELAVQTALVVLMGRECVAWVARVQPEKDGMQVWVGMSVALLDAAPA